jgi:hypothetical protein
MIYKRIFDRGEIFIPEMKDAGMRAVTPHPQWSICGTDNTKGDGEDMDKYPMSNVQDTAMRNAWDIMLIVKYLDEHQELELIRLLSPEMKTITANALAKFSSLVHHGFGKGEISTAFSPRQLKTICGLYNQGVSLRESTEKAYSNFCAKSEMSDVMECFRAVFGS